MKQQPYINRHERTFDAFVSPDNSSMTEQNLRLSQAEKAIDMANGRIPIIPPATIQQVDSSELLPEHISDMMGVYHSPFIDPATKARLHERLRYAYADYIQQRESKALEEEVNQKTQKEAEYSALLKKLKDDMAILGK